MKILHSMEELATLKGGFHWALGFFDGMHLGHQQVLASTKESGVQRGMICFDCHPLSLLRPERMPKLITPHAEHKAALAQQYGMDALLILPFTPELAALRPAEFLDALCKGCDVRGFSTGTNWRFGCGGSGDVDFLRLYGEEKGLLICTKDLSLDEGEVVSSSRIRAELAAGHLEHATAMLGHAFEVFGEVEQGQKLARQLGFPTANIATPAHAALPPTGVYAVSLELDGTRYAGVASLGLRPTIEEEHKIMRLETHLFHFSGDLYGRKLRVELRHFLRPEIRFPSLDALKAQMAADVEQARTFA